jgi:hypothetical protein
MGSFLIDSYNFVLSWYGPVILREHPQSNH